MVTASDSSCRCSSRSATDACIGWICWLVDGGTLSSHRPSLRNSWIAMAGQWEAWAWAWAWAWAVAWARPLTCGYSAAKGRALVVQARTLQRASMSCHADISLCDKIEPFSSSFKLHNGSRKATAGKGREEGVVCTTAAAVSLAGCGSLV